MAGWSVYDDLAARYACVVIGVRLKLYKGIFCGRYDHQ